MDPMLWQRLLATKVLLLFIVGLSLIPLGSSHVRKSNDWTEETLVLEESQKFLLEKGHGEHGGQRFSRSRSQGLGNRKFVTEVPDADHLATSETSNNLEILIAESEKGQERTSMGVQKDSLESRTSESHPGSDEADAEGLKLSIMANVDAPRSVATEAAASISESASVEDINDVQAQILASNSKRSKESSSSSRDGVHSGSRHSAGTFTKRKTLKPIVGLAAHGLLRPASTGREKDHGRLSLNRENQQQDSLDGREVMYEEDDSVRGSGQEVMANKRESKPVIEMVAKAVGPSNAESKEEQEGSTLLLRKDRKLLSDREALARVGQDFSLATFPGLVKRRSMTEEDSEEYPEQGGATEGGNSEGNQEHGGGAQGESSEDTWEESSEQVATDDAEANKVTGRLTIFTAPAPYEGLENTLQKQALRSWLALKPTPRVVLLGNHPSFYAVAGEYSEQVSVDPSIDCNYRGVPLFNSILARARASDSEYAMIIGPDVIIVGSLALVLNKAGSQFSNYVVTGALTGLGQLPTGLLKLERFNGNRVRSYVAKHSHKEVYQKVGFWLWNNFPRALFNASMPPFSFRRGKHDRWLAHEIVAAGFRDLVDASEVLTSIKIRLAPLENNAQQDNSDASKSGDDAEQGIEHGTDEWLTPVYAYTTPPGPGEGEKEPVLIKLRKWTTAKRHLEELRVNRQLAEAHMVEAVKRTLPLPGKVWKFSPCEENSRSSFCLVQMECSNQNDLNPSERQWVCCQVALQVPPPGIASLPGSESPPPNYNPLKDLLPLVATPDKIVTLVAVSGRYKDMLMSFVCMIRRLELPNVLVAALDPDMYQFAVEQGLAVFYDERAQRIHLENAGNDCNFGSLCFSRTVKSKSPAVLEVLKHGYSVLFSDVDIVWFRDPLPELVAYGPGKFPIQSDQPDENLLPNGANGTSHQGGALNSGFYFARAEPKVVEAFEAIIAHAQTSWNEQPSFLKVLCGVDGSYAVGGELCVWPPNGLETVMLPTRLHPNGRIYGYFDMQDTAGECISHGCATIHSNWVQGRDKLDRLKRKGFWWYDSKNRICQYDWYKSIQGL